MGLFNMGLSGIGGRVKGMLAAAAAAHQ